MESKNNSNHASIDFESETFLKNLSEVEKVKGEKVPGVKTVLVVLSASGMAFDQDSLRQKILRTYSDSAVFFVTTKGKPLGVFAPKSVDLLIDFTGPGQRQWFLFPKTLRRMARVAVGRNAGFFRKKIYDRVIDEKGQQSHLPANSIDKQRLVQKLVLGLAGVPLSLSGPTLEDLSAKIALDLPPLSKLTR